VRIWEHTFSELTGAKAPLDGPDGPNVQQPFIPESVVPITDNPRFATALIRGSLSMANQALLELSDGEWRCVGSYVDDTIFLDGHVRRQGLAEELMLRCAEHRHQLPLSTNFTLKGYLLLKRTHRRAIQCALRVGLEVPDEVLADYPDLKP
jgi:hypothetical protein